MSLAPALRVLGAVLLLGVGRDHIEQYYGGSYSVVPTIGTLFALNFAAATLVAAAPAGCSASPSRATGRRSSCRWSSS
jgi:hypothetical protein